MVEGRLAAAADAEVGAGAQGIADIGFRSADGLGGRRPLRQLSGNGRGQAAPCAVRVAGAADTGRAPAAG